MQNLTIIEESSGNFVIVGNLTFVNINQQTLRNFNLPKGLDKINVDLSKIETTDSAGLALLIELIKMSRLNHYHIFFKNIPNQLLSIAKLCGFDKNEYFSQ